VLSLGFPLEHALAFGAARPFLCVHDQLRRELGLLPRLVPGKTAKGELLQRCRAGEIVSGGPLFDDCENLPRKSDANRRANGAVIL